VHNKSLEPDQNDALRALVRELIDRDFDGKVSVAAKAEPPISHSLLFEFLDGRRGAGVKLLNWISARTGRGIDELLGRTPPRSTVSDDGRPIYGNLPPYPELERQARLRPGAAIYQEQDWQAARQFSGIMAPGELTVDFVLALVMAARELRMHPGPSAEDKKVDAQIKADETRYRNQLAKKRAAERPSERSSDGLKLEPPAAKKSRKK
jgi:hypothetical protein